jgi:Spy/CpxP family protein refolding chaperone
VLRLRAWNRSASTLRCIIEFSRQSDAEACMPCDMASSIVASTISRWHWSCMSDHTMEERMASMACRVGIVMTVLLGAVASAGCGGSAAGAAPAAGVPSESGDDEATAGVIEHHRYHQHGGAMLFIAMSIDTLGVSAEQRAAVEKIRADLEAQMGPARAAERNLETVLASGLDAGNVDAAMVDAAVAQLATASAALQDASASALNELHASLIPPQRAALADKVESHWAVWQKANADENGSAKPEGGQLAALAADIDLTPDQENKIRAHLAEGMKGMPRLDPQEMTAQLRAFGDAFRSERFDARALGSASAANAHLVGWGGAHMAHFIETVSPVLTSDQRVKLAQRLREHAMHNPSAEGNR